MEIKNVRKKTTKSLLIKLYIKRPILTVHRKYINNTTNPISKKYLLTLGSQLLRIKASSAAKLYSKWRISLRIRMNK